MSMLTLATSETHNCSSVSVQSGCLFCELCTPIVPDDYESSDGGSLPGKGLEGRWLGVTWAEARDTVVMHRESTGAEMC